jgi:hypothetical protein
MVPVATPTAATSNTAKLSNRLRIVSPRSF